MEFAKKMTQYEKILWYLRKFGSISPMEAFNDLHITKLATRISEMKKRGYKFEQSYDTHTNMLGETSRFMRYRLAA